MTKIKMLVMGAMMAGFVAGAVPMAIADSTPALHSEYGYQNDRSVKKRVAEPKFMKKDHHKKKHHKKMKKKAKKHAEARHHNYPNECNKPPCNGTSN
jgi:hypothetical protein